MGRDFMIGCRDMHTQLNMKSQLDIESCVQRSPSPLASRVGDDLVLFSVSRGMYYGVPVVGRRIWDLMEDQITVSAICDQLMREFSVERDACENEVLDFIAQLEAEELVVRL
ncbi:coenzyme PQQ synthesis protein D (PqqD) [Halomonas ventosae]|uniref:Coenzyme PQQ synthesis protein D (PqqD) n=1 Tax=Halomonas ventosae TaxID=229007 RepID=A0A4R6ZQH3_9GAMM|nr:PqqD family peptide modification chaperone [Halomonas ventosae]TDR54873.1 coenzyme PQQ synthesis protein D (PqqD) [Halomonas ventosae]